jgi:ACS family glucarate transporter-like MFS transporter
MKPEKLVDQGPRPTHVRWQILAILSTMMVVTALGRLNLGISARFMQDDFHLTTETMGWILGAFAFGYAIFQIPCGWAGDRYGPRVTLTFALIGWGLCTILFAVVPSFHWSSPLALAWSLAAIRLLTGAGEAASYPNANKVVAWWTTSRERGLGSSFLLGGVGAGGIVAPILFAATISRWGWRSSFIVTGILAMVVALVWYSFSTNHPHEHPKVNAAELAILSSSTGAGGGSHAFSLQGTPWRKIFSSGSVWALLLSYFCHGYTPFIYFTWFFVYLTKVRGLTITKGAVWGTTPFVSMTVMALLGGWLSDKAVARFGRRRGRQSTACLGMTCSAILLAAGSHAVGPISAVLLLAGAAGFGSFAAPSWWASCIDMTPHYSGSLSGLMNTCANIAGGLAPVVTAHIATCFGWSQALDFAAMINLTAGIIWLFVNADVNLEAESPAAPEYSAAAPPEKGGVHHND